MLHHFTSTKGILSKRRSAWWAVALAVSLVPLGGCDSQQDGDPGADGTDGLSTLVRTNTEPTGIHCVAGGIAISTGADEDSNGLLTAGEVDDVRYVCNGDAPDEGPTVLVDTQPESAGSHCVDGGIALTYGLDLNDDGALNPGEALWTSYLCNGEDGIAGDPGAGGENGNPVVFTTQAEAPGTNCLAGGRLMTFGLDVDSSGTLEPGEVDGNFYVCDGHSSLPVQLLDMRVQGWLDINRTAINQLIVKHGVVSTGFDPTQRPVAVFDWDNTIIKNDFTDLMLAWMIRNSALLQPPDKDWSQTNGTLTSDAVNALDKACSALAAPGEPLDTADSSGASCGAEIFSIYYAGTTVNGDLAWADQSTYSCKHTYAWVSQLMTGHTPYAISGYARQAFSEAVNAHSNAMLTIGTIAIPARVDVYPAMRNLIETLDANGFDVWIITEAPQYVVEAVIFDAVGLTPDRVIGSRPLLKNGRVTPVFQGCGDAADGTTAVIPYYDGKRCWMYKSIFGIERNKGERGGDPSTSPVFVAGDSETDVAMLLEATGLRLAINRGNQELMCHALQNTTGLWLVQPMFIDPKPGGTTYICGDVLDPAGFPIVGENGKPIPRQVD